MTKKEFIDRIDQIDPDDSDALDRLSELFEEDYLTAGENLNYEQPTNVNMVVDEMLAICSEIDAWREKKTSIESNIKYNELLYFGLDDSD